MFRATELCGRSVVDVDTGRKLGRVDQVILDPRARRVAALVVSSGRSLLDSGQRVEIPATAILAIGPDALTVRYLEGAADAADLEQLPRLEDVVGKRVVTQGGTLVGSVDDVLLDAARGRIVGYALGPAGGAGRLEQQITRLFSGTEARADARVIPAEVDVRLGGDVIVIPDAAAPSDDRPDRLDEAVRLDWERAPADGADEQMAAAPTEAVQERLADGRAERFSAPPGEARHPEPARKRLTTAEEPAAAPAARAADRWEDVAPFFRSRWEQRAAEHRAAWEEEEPRYRFGWDRATLADYHGRTWHEAEPDLQREWEARYPESPWHAAGQAVRVAWDAANSGARR